jgi:hypothetical protein
MSQEPTPQQRELAQSLAAMNESLRQGYIRTAQIMQPVAEAFNRDMETFAATYSQACRDMGRSINRNY